MEARLTQVPCPAGGVDITKAPYLANNTGTTDVSGAFKKAVDDAAVKTICVPPGTYFFSKHVFLRTGQDLNLLGLSSDPAKTRLTWNSEINPFHSSPVRGPETRVRSFTVKNLTFDGQASTGRSFNVLSSNDSGAFVEISNSVFQNIDNLPIWVEGFQRVLLTHSKFSRTKDPAIIWSKNIEISYNDVRDSADNCMSVSRGDSAVRVIYNTFTNCKSAGLFVGGIDYPGDPGTSFTLRSANGTSVGSTCTLGSSADYFRYGMIGKHLTLRRPPNFVILTITGWNENDLKSAPCELYTSLPAGFVGVPTNQWDDGPHFSGSGITVRNNVITGSLGHGIKLSMAPQDLDVAYNTVTNSGSYVDRSGQVTNADGGVFGIVAIGWYLGAEDHAHRYADDVFIGKNTIVGSQTGGIRIGSEVTGGSRNVHTEFNRIDLSSSRGWLGVLVDEDPRMPTSGNSVYENDVVFNPATNNTYATRVDPPLSGHCEVFTALSVKSMVNGDCAIWADGACQRSVAPTSLGCAP